MTIIIVYKSKLYINDFCAHKCAIRDLSAVTWPILRYLISCSSRDQQYVLIVFQGTLSQVVYTIL